MIVEDLSEVEATLRRIRKFSKVAGIILNVVFFASVLYWLFFSLATILTIVLDIDLPFVTNGNPLLIAPLVCSGLLLAALFKTGAVVFLDVSRGDSPFTLVQAYRLRRSSVIVLLYAAFEALLSPGFMAILELNGFEIGYSLVDHSTDFSISVNVGALILAAVLFSLSLIFKYGVLLQEFSDETL